MTAEAELNKAIANLHTAEKTVNALTKAHLPIQHKTVFYVVARKIPLKEKILLKVTLWVVLLIALKKERYKILFFGILIIIGIFAVMLLFRSVIIMSMHLAIHSSLKASFYKKHTLLKIIVSYKTTIYTASVLTFLAASWLLSPAAVEATEVKKWKEAHADVVEIVCKKLIELPAYFLKESKVEKLICSEVKERFGEENLKTMLCLALESKLSIKELLEISTKTT